MYLVPRDIISPEVSQVSGCTIYSAMVTMDGRVLRSLWINALRRCLNGIID